MSLLLIDDKRERRVTQRMRTSLGKIIVNKTFALGILVREKARTVHYGDFTVPNLVYHM
jgi:hypothetical protein